MVISLKIGKPAAKQLKQVFYKRRYTKVERRIKDFIPEIKDYYTVNSKGEFFSDNSGKMKTRDRAGTDYQIINFTLENGKKKTYRAHRLVLMAFNPVEGMENLEVNHIDGNKRNNQLENLEWCNASENQKHAFRLGLQKARKGEKSNFSKLSQEQIVLIFELRKQGMTQQEIAEIIGCTRSNISYILNKKTWQS